MVAKAKIRIDDRQSIQLLHAQIINLLYEIGKSFSQHCARILSKDINSQYQLLTEER